MTWARRLLTALLGAVLLSGSSLTTAAENDRLWGRAPEEWLAGQLEDKRPPAPLPEPWYALRLQGTALEISKVARTRASRDKFAVKAGGSKSVPNQSFRHVLDLPTGTVMAVCSLDDSADDARLRALVGRHVNQLSSPALLTAQWRQPVTAGEAERWELFTEVQRRPDGQLLAGSLRLMARKAADGSVTELLPPAHGMAFRRQDLLWLGWLPNDTQPSLLLKRTRLTGEEELVAMVNSRMALVTTDPDAPSRSFSSGVDESAAFEQTPFGQKRAPEALADGSPLGFDASEWVRRMEAAEKTPLVARRLMQQQASVGGEPLKVFVDYLPRLAHPTEGNHASSASPDVWGGSLLLKVEFRGKTSVLMEAGFIEDPLGLTVGRTSDGVPAIEMNYVPHYNNSFSRSWIWDDGAGRFRRWTDYQSQGC